MATPLPVNATDGATGLPEFDWKMAVKMVSMWMANYKWSNE